MPTGPASNSQSVDVIVMPRHLLEVRIVPGLFMRHSHECLDFIVGQTDTYT